MNFDISPLWISVRTACVAGVITFVLGILCARLFLNINTHFKWLVDVIFTLPLVLPPTVVGFFLLVFLGKNSLVGRFLDQFDSSIIFTWQATVIAAVVVSLPLMYRSTKGAFEQVDISTIWAARTLGMSEAKIFLKILIPQAWPGILAGAVLSFARGLGEFGATLMIAGNIPHRTQTIPVAIYFATASGDMRTAGIWVATITVISAVVLAAMNFWEITQKKKKQQI